MRKYLQRFWPWKKFVELENEISQLKDLAESHKVAHGNALALLRDESVAHSETKQHLKVVKDAHSGSQNSMRRLVNIVAMKHGLK